MSKRWHPVAIPGASGAIEGAPKGGLGSFGGWTLRNTAATAVQVDFYDNASAGSGTLLGTIDLTAKGSVGATSTVEFDEGGVAYANGVYALYSATGVQGSVFIN